MPMSQKYTSQGFLLLAAFAASFLALSSGAKGADIGASPGESPWLQAGPTCYRIPSVILPDDEHDDPASGAETETWCYQRLQDPANALFIFSADLGPERRIKPELAAIVEKDGTITQASLLAGSVAYYRVEPNGYNPLPVPLDPSEIHGERVEPPSSPQWDDSARAALNLLLTQAVRTEDARLREGVTRADARVVPWRGFWWPYKSARLWKGKSSPMAKYDRYVRSQNGTSDAQAWEAKYHAGGGVSWHGHCNGWAASSILRPEPDHPVKDRKSGVTFSVGDLKGLLAEKDNCVKFAFFGDRFRGEPGDDRKDIYPALFHQTLIHYIGQLRKPVVMDAMQGKGIENRVVSGYVMSIKRSGASKFTVEATLKVHPYDKGLSNATGEAPVKQVRFKYTLEQDANGNIKGGRWLSKNPDFLWVPLSEAQCRPTNPFVTSEWINQILE